MGNGAVSLIQLKEQSRLMRRSAIKMKTASIDALMTVSVAMTMMIVVVSVNKDDEEMVMWPIS